MNSKLQGWLFAFALCFLFLLGFGARRAVLETQYAALGRDFPFTLESALHYRRVKIIYDTGNFPKLDKGVEFPEGVQARRIYEFGSEYVQAALVKLMPDTMSVGDRLRVVESAWFCLGIPFLALWVYGMTGRRIGGLLSALLYAVAISGVMRSTGQELSKENFALPLLLAHLAFEALGRRSGKLWQVWISAALLGGALWNWDLIQYYVLLRAVWTAWRFARLKPVDFVRERWFALAVLAVGVASPYYAAHGFVYSPTMLLIYGIAAGQFLPPARGWRVSAVLLPLLVAPLLIWLSGYAESYSHFASLLWAKIRCLNHKPADPARLSFENRIMWVPALHSATIPLTLHILPAMLPISLVSAVGLIRQRRRIEIGQLYLYYFASLVTFVLFVRFHVFVAIFASALTGCWVAHALSSRGFRAWFPAILWSVAFVVEAGNTLYKPARWGRSNVYYDELKELDAWLKKNVAPDPVLANFGVSGSIAAYGECPIILHPKFESPDIRNRVREYGEALFKGDERGFRDWADEVGAVYYVYAKGEFSEVAPELQMRYFVNALNPREDAPARLFEFHPEKLKWFRYEWGNTKYSVFKILTRADEVAADRFAALARQALEQGDLKQAEQRALESVKRNPNQAVALEVIRHAAALRDRGFETQSE